MVASQSKDFFARRLLFVKLAVGKTFSLVLWVYKRLCGGRSSFNEIPGLNFSRIALGVNILLPRSAEHV